MDQPIGNVDKSSLLARIVATPKVASEAGAQARVTDWLRDIAGSVAGDQLARLFAEHRAANALVAALAEHSPYLWDLVRADPGRFLALLRSDPDTRIEAILAEANSTVPAGDDAAVMRTLRCMKAEAALLTALADVGGVWPVMHVTS